MILNNTAWEKDLLNRKGEGQYLSNYLIQRYENDKDSSFVLNINAEWGFGKTYFLTNLSKELETKKHPVVYFDAWKNDYTDQPLLAFISELNTSLTPYFTKSTRATALLKETINISKNILLPIISKKLTGFGINEIENLLDTEINSDIENGISSILSKTAEIALSEHKNIKDSIKIFKNKMIELLKQIDTNMTSKNLPMFIFIDELDRCRPNYAIELLENIKHIFDIPGIVFVVATDSKELSHAINAVYGNNFASERYLKRFFNQEYNLVKPDNYNFANHLFEVNNILNNQKLFSPLEKSCYTDKNINIELFSLYSSLFKLGLRDQEQVATVLSAVTLTWQDDKPIHLGYLLFLIMLKQKKNSLFYSFIENDDLSFLTAKENNLLFSPLIQYFASTPNRYDTFEKKENSILDLIHIYISIIDKNLEQLHNTHSKNTVTQNVINKVISELPNSYMSSDGPPKSNLDKYPEYVLRAGQFS